MDVLKKYLKFNNKDIVIYLLYKWVFFATINLNKLRKYRLSKDYIIILTSQIFTTF